MKICRSGEGPACSFLGNMFRFGCCVEADSGKALQFFKLGCDLADQSSCDAYGIMLRERGGAANLQAAVAAFDGACRSGDGLGCTLLGIMYTVGQGVTRDLDRARSLFERSCRRGFEGGCYNLANLYAGLCHWGEAVAVLRDSCDRRSIDACSELGGWLIASEFDLPDPVEGMFLLEIACSGNDPRACGRLGRELLTGRLTQSDTSRGLHLLRVGCENGWPPSCLFSAQAYERGTGGVVDSELARAYYEKACKGGVDEACRAIGTPKEEQ